MNSILNNKYILTFNPLKATHCTFKGEQVKEGQERTIYKCKFKEVSSFGKRILDVNGIDVAAMYLNLYKAK